MYSVTWPLDPVSHAEDHMDFQSLTPEEEDQLFSPMSQEAYSDEWDDPKDDEFPLSEADL